MQGEVFALLFLTHALMGIQCRYKMQVFGIKVPGKYHCVFLCSHTHLCSPAIHSCEQNSKLDGYAIWTSTTIHTFLLERKKVMIKECWENY